MRLAISPHSTDRVDIIDLWQDQKVIGKITAEPGYWSWIIEGRGTGISKTYQGAVKAAWEAFYKERNDDHRQRSSSLES